MKKIFLLFVCAASFGLANAQSAKPVEFSAGVNLGLPIGDFGKSHSFGFGFEGLGEYKISDAASLTGSLGYTHFIGKEIVEGFKAKGLGVIPILVGGRYYPSNEFFVGAKLGYGIFTGGGDGGAFTLVPQVGYNAEKYQLALGYNFLSQSGGNASYFGLSGVYKFSNK